MCDALKHYPSSEGTLQTTISYCVKSQYIIMFVVSHYCKRHKEIKDAYLLKSKYPKDNCWVTNLSSLHTFSCAALNLLGAIGPPIDTQHAKNSHVKRIYFRWSCIPTNQSVLFHAPFNRFCFPLKIVTNFFSLTSKRPLCLPRLLRPILTQLVFLIRI